MSQVTMREKSGNSSAKRKYRGSIMSFISQEERPKHHRTEETQDIQIELDMAEGDEIVSVNLIPDNSNSGSEVWKHFNRFKVVIKNTFSNEEVEFDRHFCVFPECGKSYVPGQSTNNLKDHLYKAHSIQINKPNNINLERTRASEPDQFKLQRLMTLFIISSGNHLFLIIELFKLY